MRPEDVIITIVGAVFASTGFWAFLNNLIQEKRTKESVERTALLGLLHDKIYFLCKEYIKKGHVTIEEYDNLTYLYTPYEKLGGNGTGKRLYEQVKGLPIREEDNNEAS